MPDLARIMNIVSVSFELDLFWRDVRSGKEEARLQPDLLCMICIACATAY